MTSDIMAKWGSYDMHVCSLCNGNAESHDHLFFECPFSAAIQNDLQVKKGLQLIASKWNLIIDELAEKPNGNSIGSIVRRLCLGAAVYNIWRERNYRIFREEKRCWQNVLSDIIDTVRLRLMGLSVKDTQAVKQVSSQWNVVMQKP